MSSLLLDPQAYYDQRYGLQSASKESTADPQAYCVERSVYQAYRVERSVYHRPTGNASIYSVRSLLQTFEASVSIYQSTEAFEPEDQAYSGIESPTRLTVTLEAFGPEGSSLRKDQAQLSITANV